LKDPAPIVGCRGTGLDELVNDEPALTLAVPLRQVPLRWDGDIAGGLPTRADAEIEGGSLDADGRGS
jgi:hypothetical protein